MNFERVKRNYNSGLWTKSMVAMAVKKGIITELDYAVITGERYSE